MPRFSIPQNIAEFYREFPNLISDKVAETLDRLGFAAPYTVEDISQDVILRFRPWEMDFNPRNLHRHNYRQWVGQVLQQVAEEQIRDRERYIYGPFSHLQSINRPRRYETEGPRGVASPIGPRVGDMWYDVARREYQTVTVDGTFQRVEYIHPPRGACQRVDSAPRAEMTRADLLSLYQESSLMNQNMSQALGLTDAQYRGIFPTQ